jgi:hypothetical protein
MPPGSLMKPTIGNLPRTEVLIFSQPPIGAVRRIGAPQDDASQFNLAVASNIP